MATPINHQQLLFTASLVDLPLSNTILKEKCVLVGSLHLKRIWAGILFDRSSTTVSVAMVARRRMIDTPLYAMQDGNEWLKVNASHGWLRACGAPILHRKVGKGWFFYENMEISELTKHKLLRIFGLSLIRAHGPFLHRRSYIYILIYLSVPLRYDCTDFFAVDFLLMGIIGCTKALIIVINRELQQSCFYNHNHHGIL